MSSRGKSTPDQARDARARAWAYIFDCYYAREPGEAAGEGANGNEKAARTVAAETR